MASNQTIILALRPILKDVTELTKRRNIRCLIEKRKDLLPKNASVEQATGVIFLAHRSGILNLIAAPATAGKMVNTVSANSAASMSPASKANVAGVVTASSSGTISTTTQLRGNLEPNCDGDWRVRPQLDTNTRGPDGPEANNMSDGSEKTPAQTHPGSIAVPRTIAKLTLSEGPSAHSCLYLPYEIQHQLFSDVQRLLERSCFDFAQTHIGQYLLDHELTSPDSVELTKWHEIFNKSGLCLPLEDAAAKEDICLALDAVSPLRHAAVHRERLSLLEIDKRFAAAERVFNLLGNSLIAEKVKTTRHRLDQNLRKFDTVLESRLLQHETEVAAIRAAQEELRRRESLLHQRLADERVALKKSTSQVAADDIRWMWQMTTAGKVFELASVCLMYLLSLFGRRYNDVIASLTLLLHLPLHSKRDYS